MKPLSDQQLQALRELVTLWGEAKFVLVGASALGCFLDFRWRTTQDLDLSVLLSVDEYLAGLETLAGWRHDSRLEHRWHAPGNVAVDFVPIGGVTADETAITWPASGFRMSIVGFRLAFDQARSLELAANVRIRVAPPAAVAILKMVAYLDRPREREKDLEDLAYLLEEYLQDDDDRRFSNDVVELQLDYEDVSAYHLGRDIVAMAGAREVDAVSEFVSRSLSEDDPSATLARLARAGPVSWQENREAPLRRLRAFEQGLRSGQRSG